MEVSALIKSVFDNQVVTGLSITAILGGIMYQMRDIPRLLQRGFLRFFTVELMVLSTDPVFDWIDAWLAKHPYTSKSKIIRLRMIEHDDDYASHDKVDPGNWTFAPGEGMHLFYWRHRPVALSRSFMSKDETMSSGRGKPIEQLRFRTLGRSQSIIRDLINEAHSLALEKETVSIRMWADYHWAHARGRTRRQLDTVILKPQQMMRIIADLEWFLGARDWYSTRGIPYRRGYLFAGRPGTGKTSIVLALAGYLGRPICVLNLGSLDNDESLYEALREAPVNAIILMEDIDCAMPAQTREIADDNKDDSNAAVAGAISKAGILNALDGITTPEGRIFIMTTNFPDRLDAALIRPGRADVHEMFDYFEAAEQISMAKRFYQEFEPVPFPVSPAEMQAAFMQYPNNSKAARDHLLKKLESAVESTN